jgi:hypothetical protein
MIFIPLSASACALTRKESTKQGRNRGSAALASKRKMLIVGVAMETCPSWIIRCGLALSDRTSRQLHADLEGKQNSPE